MFPSRVLHCRDEASCIRAKDDVTAAASSGIKKHGNSVSVETADLSAMPSVQALAKRLEATTQRIDIAYSKRLLCDVSYIVSDFSCCYLSH